MNDAIRELGQQLSSDDPYERETSALELAELEDLQAAPFLVRGLEDPAEPVRRWSAYGLAKLERPEHAPPLRRVLEKDPAARVRIQAAYGLARLGERGALEKLAQALSSPTPVVRREAAVLLLALQDPPSTSPLLRPLLDQGDERARAWAAGVLHALGEPRAFQKWHSALATPEARRDAVLAAPLMREARAIRELLRLMVELPPEELDAAEEEVPALKESLCDALRLAGLELLLDTEADEALRADLLVLLGRHREVLPELVEDIVEALGRRPPDALGRELAQLLSEQEPEARGGFFASVAPLFPKTALPTLAELKAAERDEVLRSVVEAARAAGGSDPELVALCEELAATPYGHFFEGLPLDALDGATQESAIPNEEELFEEEPDEEEDPWTESSPPEADAVAQRALVLGGLLRRLALEERLEQAKDASAKKEILRLQAWMDEEGLFSTLGIPSLELLEAEPGTWPQEIRQSVSWIAEELQLLLWALMLGKLPSVEKRVDAPPLLERLPLLKDPQPFLESAQRRPIEEVEAQRDRWEVILECGRYESFARGIAADPSIAEGDPDLELLLESAVEVGFDRRGVSAKHGKAQAAVEGLRHWSCHLVTELQQQGLLAGTPGEGLAFQGQRLHELEPSALGTLLSLAHARFEALEWLTSGGASAPDGEDEAG